MSINNVEDEILSPRSLDEPESARKRMRLENSARKSWSLTEKQTDQEVLQEMGVSLLEPDEMDPACDLDTSASLIKSGSKRKRDIENVNPNVNSGKSSAHKTSPKKSPKKICSPVPGPSVLCSPGSLEFSGKPEQTQETTFLTPYVVEEETPESQFSCNEYRRAGAAAWFYTPSEEIPAVHTPREELAAVDTPCEGLEVAHTPLGSEVHSPARHSRDLPSGEDSFSSLSDEVLLSIFKWLPKRTLAHCMQVCKRWHRIASDETFWQRLELGNRSIAKGALGRMLARKPVIVRLAGSEIGEWHPTGPVEMSRLQYLDLSMSSIDRLTLKCLLERCSLHKLSLEAVAVDDTICELIGKCNKMETLNLTMATGITSEGLKYILEGCTSLQSLNISWCNLCVTSLKLLGSTAPQKLQRLNVAGARLMTDDMISSLVSRCPRLVELDLSDCSRLGAAAVMSLLSLHRLEHLALSRGYLLPPHVLTKLGSMPALQYLEVWGMLQDASLAALKGALPAIQMNQFMHSAIARPTVGTRRTSIWGLRTRD